MSLEPLCLHENKNSSTNGFALRLSLKQRRKATRKWPIGHFEFETYYSSPGLTHHFYVEQV